MAADSSGRREEGEMVAMMLSAMNESIDSNKESARRKAWRREVVCSNVGM